MMNIANNIIPCHLLHFIAEVKNKNIIFVNNRNIAKKYIISPITIVPSIAVIPNINVKFVINDPIISPKAKE